MEPSAKVEADFEEALRWLNQRRERILQLLRDSAENRRGGVIEPRCLALMDMEISDILSFLESCPLELRDDDYYKSMWIWLKKLDGSVGRILESTEPRRYTLLDQAAVYCRLKKPNSLVHMTERFLIEADDPLAHMLHPLPMSPSCDIKLLPHQEAGGIPVVGMDIPMKNLLRWSAAGWDFFDWLTRGWSYRLSVMAVVGPSGIGKTTLATELYNQHIKCQKEGGGRPFDIMARRLKGDDGNKHLFQEIISKFSDTEALKLSSDQAATVEQLVPCVSKLLHNKRYFIYIDDITEGSEWEEIKGAFPNNSLGSRILITTCVRSTAWLCCSGSSYKGIVHQMKPLNLADSKRLLITRTFDSPDAIPPDNTVKQLIDKILMRCDGRPLFINGMAEWLKELLQLKHHQEYEKVLDACVPKQLVSALSAAYDKLPYYLKIQSLYMSIFPYGYEFDRHRLMSKSPHGYWCDKCLPYLSDLVDRNIITRVATIGKSDPDGGEAGQWHINHFMHQFLNYKSAENCGFAFTSDYLKVLPVSKVPRRLALHNLNPLIQSMIMGKEYFLETRSLAVSCVDKKYKIPLEKFVNLLELNLEGWKSLTDRDLKEICESKMFFLQYLCLRNTEIKTLPQEIKYLCNLKVLDVSCTCIRELPLEVFKLKFLHELDLRDTRISQVPMQIGLLRPSLSALLLGHHEGKFSSTEITRVCQDVVHLTELQTLATIDLSEQPVGFVNGLGNLSQLLVLAITWSFHQCTDQEYREALLSSIQKWYCLKSLTIHCGLGCSMEFLGTLKFGHINLEKFKVTKGRFASVPKWIRKHRNLSFLQITICKESTDDLMVLGGLPRLQCLILGLDFIPVETIVIESEGFEQLDRFSVDCPNPWLHFRTGAMWKLTYLQLKFCAIPMTKIGVPSGVKHLRNLTEVDLRFNKRYANSPSVKNTVAEVRKQVATHLNLIDFFINGIQDYDVQAAADEAAESEDGVQPVAEEVARVAITTTNQIQSTSEIEEVISDA